MAVFGPLFYRILWMAGISEPREFATDDDKNSILASYLHLEVRPGAAECISILHQGGFRVWGYTAGDLARVSGYFKHA
jgi:2-haloacid dehalogenase